LRRHFTRPIDDHFLRGKIGDGQERADTQGGNAGNAHKASIGLEKRFVGILTRRTAVRMLNFSRFVSVIRASRAVALLRTMIEQEQGRKGAALFC
jgi:hypothetical protein